MPTVDGLHVWTLARGPEGGTPFDAGAVMAAARQARQLGLSRWTVSTATRDALGLTVCTIYGPAARATRWVAAVLEVDVLLDDSYPFGVVAVSPA